MKYLNITKARTTFLRLVDDLDERTAITRDGQPVAILLNFDDYRALVTAQALVRDPERFKNINAVAARFQAGDVESFEKAQPFIDELSVGTTEDRTTPAYRKARMKLLRARNVTDLNVTDLSDDELSRPILTKTSKVRSAKATRQEREQ